MRIGIVEAGVGVVPVVAKAVERLARRHDRPVLMVGAKSDGVREEVSRMGKQLGLEVEPHDLSSGAVAFLQLVRKVDQVVFLWDGSDAMLAGAVMAAIAAKKQLYLYYATSDAWYMERRLVDDLARAAVARERTANPSWNLGKEERWGRRARDPV